VKKLLFVTMVMVLALVFVGCADNRTANPVRAGVTDRSDQLFIQVSALGSLPYFYDHRMGMERVGLEMGVRTEFVGPADLDINAMIAAFEQAIARRPQGIVVVGFEESLNPIVNEAVRQGIPVVTVDADLPNSDRIAFVGTGNFNAGRTGGEYLASLINGRGTVAILTMPGQSNLEERVAGYLHAFNNFPDIEVVQIADTRSDPVVAAQAAAAILQRHPYLTAFVCTESAGGAGAAMAVREAGLVGRVHIIAMDRDNEVVSAIEEGVITASVAQQTALMPFYATLILYNLYNSAVSITTNNQAAGVAGVPQMIDTGVVIVNADNARYFWRR